MMTIIASFKTSCSTTRKRVPSSREPGGVRKVRMRLPGRGKSGGARVIYLYLENHAVIYLLTLYTKKEQTDLSPEQKKAISSVVEEIKRAYRGRVQLR
jgi:hypothetical protein